METPKPQQTLDIEISPSESEWSPEEIELGEKVVELIKQVAGIVRKLTVVDLRFLSAAEKEKLSAEWDTVDKVVSIILAGSLVTALNSEIFVALRENPQAFKEMAASSLAYSLIPLSLAAAELCSRKIQRKFKLNYENPIIKYFFSSPDSE